MVDFFDIEASSRPVLASLDHYCLNDVAGLDNSTAENIALWIWDRVKPALPQLSRVRVFETADCSADYEADAATD